MTKNNLRDEFPKNIKETLAKRVSYFCSNPKCRKMTIGPHTDANKSVSVGVAAHISAASPGGPRYDATLTSSDRKSIKNGIWLCQNCGREVDIDEIRFTKSILEAWKREAESLVVKKTIEEKYKSSKKVISKIQDIEEMYEYFNEYYIANFDHFFSFNDAMVSLRKHYYLHSPIMTQINTLNELISKVLEEFRKIKLDINPKTSKLIKKYLDTLKFTYEDDGIGFYNNRLERFFENMIDTKITRIQIIKELSNCI
ncbi:hypothetical protein [Paenibacillus odorifer]|uniref:hypothetical protein n=1 Tax=Paenibacillus odorifer TaxID=189426 RepID=UPI001595F171|nr:hypothetical protein [Paenibacillus odorifer]